MAEPSNTQGGSGQGGSGQGGDAPVSEPDTLFRIQVGIQDFFLANARYLGVIIAVGIAGFAVYGTYDWWTTRAARAEFGAVADVDFLMPRAADYSELGLVPADDPKDLGRLADVEEGANRYEKAARAAHGVAAVYGWLKAGATWQRLGKTDKALAAYAEADKIGASDLPGFAAANGYATALAGAGRTDEAITVMRAAGTRLKDFYAESALIQLAQLQVDAGKAADAQLVVQEFQTRFPDSPRKARLAAAGLTSPTSGAAPAGAAPSNGGGAAPASPGEAAPASGG